MKNSLMLLGGIVHFLNLDTQPLQMGSSFEVSKRKICYSATSTENQTVCPSFCSRCRGAGARSSRVSARARPPRGPASGVAIVRSRPRTRVVGGSGEWGAGNGKWSAKPPRPPNLCADSDQNCFFLILRLGSCITSANGVVVT